MRLIFAALFCVMVSPSAFAEKLPAPVGKPVLTISGLITNTNEGDTAVFDVAALGKAGDGNAGDDHAMVFGKGPL